MANKDNRFGFKLVGHKSGSPFNASIHPYAIPAGYATDLFRNDPVVITGTSNADQITTGSGVYSPGTLPEINLATAGDGNPISGVIVAVNFSPSNLDVTYSPANTVGVALVCDDPDAYFEAQANGAFAVTDVGSNTNIVYDHAGNTGTGLSGAEINSSTFGQVATNQVTVMNVVDIANNEVGTNAKLQIRFNNHTNVVGVAGI